MTDSDPSDIDLNDAILALEQAEGSIDEVQNPAKVTEALEALNAVPVEALQELIAEWREQTERAKDAGTRYEHWKAIEHKADELQALIDDYSNE